MLRSQGDMRPPLSGAGSNRIQMKYRSMNGHRGGYELQVIAVSCGSSGGRGKDVQEDEGQEEANGHHVGP